MNLPLIPPATPVATSLDDLDPVATHAIRLVRMWTWGAVHRETLRLAAATQFGATNGICVVGAFDSLFALLGATAQPPLDIRPPDSHRLTDDERWFLTLVAAALAHGPAALLPLGAGRTAQGSERRLAESVHGFAHMLTACLDRKAKPAATACPVACPLHDDCTEGPRLKVVK